MNYWQRRAAAKRAVTAKSDQRAVEAMMAEMVGGQMGNPTPIRDAALRVAGLDPLVNDALVLGGVITGETQIAPSQQPETVAASVECAHPKPTAYIPKSASTAPNGMVKIDPGLSPLIFHQNRETEYRLWLVAHQLNRDLYRGRGWVSLKTLEQALPSFHVGLSSRHFKRAIAQGKGVLWERKGDQLQLTSYTRLWRDCSEVLCQQGKQTIVEACRPGNPVYVHAGGSLQTFKATLYTAWIDARNTGEGFTGSRFLLCKVWDCSENTLRTWEQGRVEHTANYAQYGGNDLRVIPTYARPYPDHNGSIRYTFRRPNTYSSVTTILEHRAKGQRGKARSIRNHILKLYALDASPADLCAAETIGRLFFTDKVDAPGSAFKSVRQHLRKHEDYQRPHYARLGMKRGYGATKSVGIWEVTDGTQQTGLHERDFNRERRKAFREYQAFDAVHREKYMG